MFTCAICKAEKVRQTHGEETKGEMVKLKNGKRVIDMTEVRRIKLETEDYTSKMHIEDHEGFEVDEDEGGIYVESGWFVPEEDLKEALSKRDSEWHAKVEKLQEYIKEQIDASSPVTQERLYLLLGFTETFFGVPFKAVEEKGGKE